MVSLSPFFLLLSLMLYLKTLEMNKTCVNLAFQEHTIQQICSKITLSWDLNELGLSHLPWFTARSQDFCHFPWVLGMAMSGSRLFLGHLCWLSLVLLQTQPLWYFHKNMYTLKHAGPHTKKISGYSRIYQREVNIFWYISLQTQLQVRHQVSLFLRYLLANQASRNFN